MKRLNRGSTLIEVMVLVSTTSVMLLVTIGLIHRTLSFSKEMEQTNSLLRLNEQVAATLRNDFRQTGSFEIQSSTTASLTLGDGRIVKYQFENAVLTRSLLETGAPDAKASSQETYTFGPNQAIRFESLTDNRGVRLLIVQEGIDLPKPLPLFTVDAYLAVVASGAKS
jgi:type II secretory pathway component PulJ